MQDRSTDDMLGIGQLARLAEVEDADDREIVEGDLATLPV